MSFDTNNLIESNHSQELISPKQNKLAFADRILRKATKAISSGTIIFRLENDLDKFTFIDKIEIKERIRDIIYFSNQNIYIMILENTPSLGIFFNKDKTKY